jgi:GNAT superfamily N-acetyltransferase
LSVFKEINYYDNKLLKQGLDIYLTYFPPQETRPLEKTISMIQKDDNYHILVAIQHETVIGISLFYIFPSLKFGLLDYMAIIKEFQGKGIGSKLFNFTFDIFSSGISDGIGLLMEIQKDNVQNIEENKIRKNRIKFYINLGCKFLHGINYLLPSQIGGQPEEMYLMIKPIKNIKSLSKFDIFKIVKAIYSNIYDYKTDNLIDKVFYNTPDLIYIQD